MKLLDFSLAFETLATMPGLQLLLLGLSAAVWLVGGNVLVAFHYRRLGQSIWSGFRFSAFPFTDFNAREWLVLAILGVASMTFARIAFAVNPG